MPTSRDLAIFVPTDRRTKTITLPLAHARGAINKISGKNNSTTLWSIYNVHCTLIYGGTLGHLLPHAVLDQHLYDTTKQLLFHDCWMTSTLHCNRLCIQKCHELRRSLKNCISDSSSCDVYHKAICYYCATSLVLNMVNTVGLDIQLVLIMTLL